MMADNQLNGGGGDNIIFVYTGGEQRVPRDVKRVRIAENVDTIQAGTFHECVQLIEVEGHEKLKKIKQSAFYDCPSLRSVTKMTGVIEIEQYAFSDCYALSELEFDKLEVIGFGGFQYCSSLRSIDMPSIKILRRMAFKRCVALTDAVFGEKLERIETYAFLDCTALRRIVIPLKDNLIIGVDLFNDGINQTFKRCENLVGVDALAGEVHETISSLHLETWSNEMEEEIERINQILPNIPAIEKTSAIQQWITIVLSRMEHYKSEHQIILKEAMTLLELALWKAKLINEANEKKCSVDVVAKKVKIDTNSARNENRVICGASIVIKNVLPFLALT